MGCHERGHTFMQRNMSGMYIMMWLWQSSSGLGEGMDDFRKTKKNRSLKVQNRPYSATDNIWLMWMVITLICNEHLYITIQL